MSTVHPIAVLGVTLTDARVASESVEGPFVLASVQSHRPLEGRSIRDFVVTPELDRLITEAESGRVFAARQLVRLAERLMHKSVVR